MSLLVAADDERQFTKHVIVDTDKRFTRLSVVYTNHLSWVENSNFMDLFLDEDKYKMVWFDLVFLMALCSRVPARALLSRPSACTLPAVVAGA
ncbi:hypothetical protein D1007_16772 [Hordeum vulgare]|nr:hypothetical protein D1007_16772 [Hordeum vulgare]